MSGRHQGRGESHRWPQLSSRRSPPSEHRIRSATGHRSADSHSSSSSHSSVGSASARAPNEERDRPQHRAPARSRETRQPPARLEEGFDVDLFIPKPEDKYVCPICLMVLRVPVQTPCGHLFCEYCIDRWSSGTRRPARCPVDNEEFSRAQLFRDNHAKREIMSLNVKCPNHKAGCTQQMELRELEDHESDCVYVQTRCIQCLLELLRKDLSDHINNDCPERPVICDHCTTSVKYSQLKDHVCIEARCNRCFGSFLPNELSFHQQTCPPKSRVPCFYAYYGCRETMLLQDEESHMKQHVVSHLYLVTSHLIQPQRAKLYDVTSSSPIVAGGSLGSVTSGYQTKSGFSTSSTYSRIPNLHSMEEPMSPVMLPVYPAVAPHHSDPNTLPLQAVRHDSCLDELPLTYPLHHKHKQREEIKPYPGREADLETMLREQDDKIRQQSSKIQQLERQVLDFEARQCNGTYIWYIKDYKRKKREAMGGRNVVHHSPGFFTSLYGYKMCVRVNLNGVEAGEGSHLALFVHLMKGDYDDILKWPFQGNICLTLLDQREDVDQRQHITEKLVAKPGLAAFNKPTQKRNLKGFGYIEFAPLDFIENDCYIKNDTIIVKTVVEPTESCAS